MTVCSVYGDIIPGHVLADRIASYIHIFNLYWYVRYGAIYRHNILLHCSVQDVCLVVACLQVAAKFIFAVTAVCYSSGSSCSVVCLVSWAHFVVSCYLIAICYLTQLSQNACLHILLMVCCRPCGASTLLATFDSDGPQLYLIEPMGIALVGTLSFYGLQDAAAKLNDSYY